MDFSLGSRTLARPQGVDPGLTTRSQTVALCYGRVDVDFCHVQVGVRAERLERFKSVLWGGYE